MTQSVFDAQDFMQSLGNDDELARELLGAFLEDSAKRKDSLEEALNADDAPRASKLAHSLKGMCGVVRSEQLVTMAYAMETSAKSGTLDTTKEQFAQFTAKLDTAFEEMHSFLND